MASSADIVVNVLTKVQDSGLKQAEGKFGKFGSVMKKAMVPAIAATGAIVAFGASAVSSASRLEQAMGGVKAVFGDNSATVEKWASDAASSIGLAKSEYGELATLIGSQLKNAGLPMDQVLTKTKGLIDKGADLAAMYGGTTAEAVEALSSALKGEFDPMDRYGGSLSAAKIAAEQAAEGTDKLTGKAADQAKAMATLNLITKQTADSEGAAAKEKDSMAAKTQQATAQYENMKAVLGTALLPIMSKFMGQLAKMATWLSKNTTVVYILVGAILAAAAAVMVINVAMLVLSANPVVLIIAGIVAAVIALGAALVYAYKKSSTFRAIVDGAFAAAKTGAAAVVTAFKAIGRATVVVFTWIKSHWRLLAAILFGPVGIAVGVITKHWGKIRSGATALLAWIKSAFRTAFSAVSSIVGTYVGAIKKTVDKVKTAVQGVVDKVRDLIAKLKDIQWPTGVKSAIDAIKTAIDNVVTAVGNLIAKLKNIPTPHINWPSPPKWLSKVGLSAVAPPPPPAGPTAATLAASPGLGAPRVRGGRARASNGGPVVINVNVTGALDPEAVARQIQRVLGAHNRRVGVRA